MYLGIAQSLARWAHDNATDIYSKATFSTIATILGGATTLISAAATIQMARVAKDEVEAVIAAVSVGRVNRPRAA